MAVVAINMRLSRLTLEAVSFLHALRTGSSEEIVLLICRGTDIWRNKGFRFFRLASSLRLRPRCWTSTSSPSWLLLLELYFKRVLIFHQIVFKQNIFFLIFHFSRILFYWYSRREFWFDFVLLHAEDDRSNANWYEPKDVWHLILITSFLSWVRSQIVVYNGVETGVSSCRQELFPTDNALSLLFID